MKQRNSIFTKLLGRSQIKLEPGDIFYFVSAKTYWLYLGEDIENMEDDKQYYTDNDTNIDIKDKLYRGINSFESISKMAFNPSCMYKVEIKNNPILPELVFHFKFVHDRSLKSIINEYNNKDLLYITTVDDNKLKELKLLFTMYNIIENEKRN